MAKNLHLVSKTFDLFLNKLNAPLEDNSNLICLLQPLAISVGLLMSEEKDNLSSLNHHEKVYSASKSVLDYFISNAPVCVAMFDKNMNYRAASKKWLQDRQLIKKDMNPQGLSYYKMSPYQSPAWEQVHKKALQGCIEQCQADEWILDESTRKWVRWEVQPWYLSENEVGGLIIFLEDISQRKAVETDFKRLLELNEELENFAYICPHDLQIHVRSVSGFVNLLKEHKNFKLDETSATYLHYINSAIEGMKSIVKNSLLFAQIKNGTIAKEYFDTRVLLDDILSSIYHILEKNRATVEIDSNTKIFAHKPSIRQVFENLISNALKFCERPPFIKIQCEETKADWVIAVKDNGIGISKEKQEKLFNCFQRLHNKEKYQGNGLGLSFCKRIIDYHGGTIHLDSTPGKGSTFYINLPKPSAA
jgi:signal transduction histidine kinase